MHNILLFTCLFSVSMVFATGEHQGKTTKVMSAEERNGLFLIWANLNKPDAFVSGTKSNSLTNPKISSAGKSLIGSNKDNLFPMGTREDPLGLDSKYNKGLKILLDYTKKIEERNVYRRFPMGTREDPLGLDPKYNGGLKVLLAYAKKIVEGEL